MSMPERAINVHIDNYTDDIEEMSRCLRRCAPSLEAYYTGRIVAAHRVCQALLDYREAIDAPHPHDTEIET